MVILDIYLNKWKERAENEKQGYVNPLKRALWNKEQEERPLKKLQIRKTSILIS